MLHFFPTFPLPNDNNDFVIKKNECANVILFHVILKMNKNLKAPGLLCLFAQFGQKMLRFLNIIKYYNNNNNTYCHCMLS